MLIFIIEIIIVIYLLKREFGKVLSDEELQKKFGHLHYFKNGKFIPRKPSEYEPKNVTKPDKKCIEKLINYKVYQEGWKNYTNDGNQMGTTGKNIESLNIQLVKKDTYILGENTNEIDVSDISKAIKLTSLTIALFTIFILIIMTIFYMII